MTSTIHRRFVGLAVAAFVAAGAHDATAQPQPWPVPRPAPVVPAPPAPSAPTAPAPPSWDFDWQADAQAAIDTARQAAAHVREQMQEWSAQFQAMGAGARADVYAGARSHDMPQDASYRAARELIDSGHYERAIELLGRVTSQGGDYAQAAMYWTAYSLGRLRRNTEALSMLSALQRR